MEKYPILQVRQRLASKHVAQLAWQEIHAPCEEKYPFIHEVHNPSVLISEQPIN
jgi:hypothetical protein